MELDKSSANVRKPKLFSVWANTWLAGNERIWMGGMLFLSDFISLLLASALALFIWSFVRSDLYPARYIHLIPVLLIFNLIYAISGTYQGAGLNPVDELRRLTLGSTAAFLGIGALSFWLRNAEQFSRAAYILAWIFSLILVPMTRKLAKGFWVNMGLWGERVAVIGYGIQGDRLVRFLEQNPKLGFRPVVVLDGFRRDNPPVSLPFYNVESIPNPQKVTFLKGVKTAFLIPSELPAEFLEKILNDQWKRFMHLIMIPDAQYLGSAWVVPHDLGGLLGLEVRQNLLSQSEQRVKRAIDLAFIIAFSPFIIIVFLILALLIRLNSDGPIFYRQTRVGFEGKKFSVWKFRTMVTNAEEVLSKHLEENSECYEEWKATFKLKDDPRVTSIGKILRRFSLDELPQLINILKGEMSLVGPRPIVKAELGLYGDKIHLYSRVKPGLTGLWQVSGRNDTTYHDRVRLDAYYVLNWSIWLDIFILQHTINTVISGRGAY